MRETFGIFSYLFCPKVYWGPPITWAGEVGWRWGWGTTVIVNASQVNVSSSCSSCNDLWLRIFDHNWSSFCRLREAEQAQNSAMFPRLGSKFRYSGRTLYQARHSSQILERPDPYFERSQPARSTYAAPSNRSRSVDECEYVVWATLGLGSLRLGTKIRLCWECEGLFQESEGLSWECSWSVEACSERPKAFL